MPSAYVLRSDDFVEFFAPNFLLVAHRLFEDLFQPFQTSLVESSERPLKFYERLTNIYQISYKFY